MHVTKMHGARNDFVVVDCRHESFDLASFARRICDRRAGIGADGVIALERSRKGDVRMRTINPDGSEAEMCGNGIRCAARWLDEAGEGGCIAFETAAGLIRTEIVSREPEYLVRVAMNRPHISPIPEVLPESTFVDVGNPHVVVFERRIDAVDLEALAATFQRNPRFADGVNVHVVERRASHSLCVRHWERGAGLTQACGTGAVACAAVAIAKRLVQSPVEVFVPGGRLVVEWDGEKEASLIGPAARVFDTDVSVGAGLGG